MTFRKLVITVQFLFCHASRKYKSGSSTTYLDQSYLVNEKTLYSKQFGFQKRSFQRACHCSVSIAKSMNHWKTRITHLGLLLIYLRPLMLLVKQCYWLKKLENQGVKGKNLGYFRSSEVNRRQYIQITNDRKSDLRNTTCGVPQGTILRRLPFLAYVYELPSSSKTLNPTIFADDTKLFHEQKLS